MSKIGIPIQYIQNATTKGGGLSTEESEEGEIGCTLG